MVRHALRLLHPNESLIRIRAVALKAVSLAFAVVAYLILLLTMVSKHDPVKGFIVTVLCWCSSAATL